jgi:polysaccharide pyruvyl transferase WcaK-like protein
VLQAGAPRPKANEPVGTALNAIDQFTHAASGFARPLPMKPCCDENRRHFVARKKIGLVGYFGYGNYGDELFLAVYRKFFHDCDLRVITSDDHNPCYPKNIDSIDDLDAIIIGGGDLFIPKYFAEQYFNPRYLTKPVYFHGTGVPLWIGQDSLPIEKMAQFVQHENIRKINMRDMESVIWTNSMLNPRVKADVSADMVFAMDLPAVTRNPAKKVFGLIMRKLMPAERELRNIEALLNRARELGYGIHNIILATGKTRLDDLEDSGDFSGNGITTIDPNDLDGLTRAIGACDVIASTKFHGCVVATAYGIPTITLTTTDKFVNLYTSIERRDLISHFIHKDLCERLPKYMPRIPELTRKALRADATEGMMRLRRSVLNELD